MEKDFEQWYRLEQPVLARSLWTICGDRDEAAEATDEAFSRALAKWDRVSSMESPGGWVRIVALNHLRRRMRRRSLEAQLLRPGRERIQHDPHLDTDLWRAVQSLPDRQREVIALRYIADLTEAEIARTLKVSEGGVSASLTKARRRLGELLDHEAEVTR